MRNEETGEFELILGNKQLLSAFGLVVILFGIFFTMGYIVGRNSVPSARVVADAEPPIVPPRRAPSQSAVQPAPEAAKPVEIGTQPAQDTDVEQPREPVVVATPGPGAYLQVMAVKQPVAEVVMKTLRDKGLPVTLAPAPNELVRVLVGPYNDTAALGKAKADLENAGFNPIVRK